MAQARGGSWLISVAAWASCAARCGRFGAPTKSHSCSSALQASGGWRRGGGGYRAGKGKGERLRNTMLPAPLARMPIRGLGPGLGGGGEGQGCRCPQEHRCIHVHRRTSSPMRNQAFDVSDVFPAAAERSIESAPRYSAGGLISCGSYEPSAPAGKSMPPLSGK